MRAAKGDDKAIKTLNITKRTSFMLSGAQLGITVAEPLIGNSLASIAGGGVSTALTLAIGSVVAIAFSTLVQMLFGELFPKNYAIAKPDEVSSALAPSTRIYLLIFGPLIWIFDKAAEGLLRLLRIEPVHDVEYVASAQDLERVVEASRVSGDLSPELSLVLDRILDFPSRDVGHAMVGRARTDTVQHDASIAQVRELMDTGHTRYPVVDDDEHIIGTVDLVDLLAAPNQQAGVTTITRDALVLAEAMPLPDALAAMRADQQQLACVVDEFGSFSGVLTLEDLAEEVVGEIVDEHDEDDLADVTVLADGWLVAGNLPLDEVERNLDIDLAPGDYETIAGLVIDTFGRLPQVGDVVLVDLVIPAADVLLGESGPRLLQAEVVAVENHVPSQLRLTLRADADGQVQA